MPIADDFRRIALAFPGAEEGSHMGHADFRVGGKIFATLGSPDEGWGMASLMPEQQEDFMALPKVLGFLPFYVVGMHMS
ncbi:MAG: MmcQ/YjbR family DNA-binding protein, partial [Allosphingosinicella sp.]